MRDAVIQRLTGRGVEWLASSGAGALRWSQDAAGAFLFFPDEAMREQAKLKAEGVWAAVAFRGRPVPSAAFFRFAMPRGYHGS